MQSRVSPVLRALGVVVTIVTPCAALIAVAEQPAHSQGLAVVSSPTPPAVVSAVPAYAPAASQAEAAVVDAARLLGIPLVRTPRFPSVSPVAFFCASALADRQFVPRLRAFVNAGGRALVTSRLASHLGRLPSEHADHVFILPSRQGAATVLALPQAQVDRLRNFVLYPLGLRMEAPPRVSLTLIGDDALVLENRNPFIAGVKLTFLATRWPMIYALATDSAEVPLIGSSVALQAPPKATQHFRIVSRP
jgi:hypothetical protein